MAVNCESDNDIFIQDCHTIFNTKVEDIKDIKDKLLSDKIKTTALYDIISEDDINLEKIAAASKLDLTFVGLHNRSEFAYFAGCKDNTSLTKDEIKDTCSEDCPCVIDSYNYESSLKLHLAVAYIPIIIANTSQNPVDVVQVGKDEFYSFEAGKEGKNVSIKIAYYKVSECFVESFKNEVNKKMIDMGYEIPEYKFDDTCQSISDEGFVCVDCILKSMKSFNVLDHCMINGITAFHTY